MWLKNAKNWHVNIYLGHKFATKKIDDLDEVVYTLFTNGYMSYRVSYNSTQTLRFKYHITFYENIWTSNLDITLYLP